mgnify:CR=1 FL=1
MCLPMTIQPLVENAIKHGFHSGASPLRVHMEGEIVDDRVRVTILNCGYLDNQSDEASIRTEGTGLGLDLLQQRLQSAFDERWSLRLVQEGHDEQPRVRAIVEWPVQKLSEVEYA